MGASIRRRLVLLVLASIVLCWGIALISSYRQATREVSEWENARLAELSQMLALLDQRNLTTLMHASMCAKKRKAASPAPTISMTTTRCRATRCSRCSAPTARCWRAARPCMR
jgi:hypothetical protein